MWQRPVFSGSDRPNEGHFRTGMTVCPLLQTDDYKIQQLAFLSQVRHIDNFLKTLHKPPVQQREWYFVKPVQQMCLHLYVLFTPLHI